MVPANINDNYNKDVLHLHDEYNYSNSDSISLLLVIKTCNNIRSQNIQRKHTLINFYATFNDINKTVNVFQSIGNNIFDCVTTNAKTSVCINKKQHSTALKLYDESNVKYTDNISQSLTIKYCANNGIFNKSNKIHSQLKKESTINDNICIKPALINLFVRCHDVNNDNNNTINTACYNILMNVYCVNQKYNQCLELFDDSKDKYYFICNWVLYHAQIVIKLKLALTFIIKYVEKYSTWFKMYVNIYTQIKLEFGTFMIQI